MLQVWLTRHISEVEAGQWTVLEELGLQGLTSHLDRSLMLYICQVVRFIYWMIEDDS